MSIKVIGAGFGRTGTMSLKIALEELGFKKCYHMMEVVDNLQHIPLWASLMRKEKVDWNALFSGYQASVDWPSANFWREQMQQFPEAKVLLSTRDPEKWYASVMKTIYPGSVMARDSKDENIAKFGHWIFEILWDGVFDGKMQDKIHCIEIFQAHQKTVINTVPKDRLLIFEAKQGWEPLCDFLQCSVPETAFPHSNSTEDFLNRTGSKRSEEI